MQVEGIEAYPWATWMTWDLEEHIGCLGWAGTWFGDAEARDLAVRDLHGLTEWPCYRQHPIPDLSSGHAMRTMWTAFKEWDWLPDDLKSQMEGAFERHIDDALPLSEEMHGRFETVEDILNLAESHTVLHNIPFIGTVGPWPHPPSLTHPRPNCSTGSRSSCYRCWGCGNKGTRNASATMGTSWISLLPGWVSPLNKTGWMS